MLFLIVGICLIKINNIAPNLDRSLSYLYRASMSYRKYPQAFNVAFIVLAIAILLLGVWFRFTNLEQSVFWVDEVSTAVRVAGYTVPEVANSLIERGIVDRDALFSYQTLSANRTWQDSLDALTQSPEHAPLYFILTRLWVQWWGDSIAELRSLSVWLSLLVFPSLYWLCRELFNKPLVSWLAMVFMGISPFYVAYAQEARPYSLWTVTILLMCASLLRAIRINDKRAWLWYCCCLVISFYTSLFSIYIAFFHCLYVMATCIKAKSGIIINYLKASTLALLAFSPWIWIIVNYLDLLQQNTSWMRGNFNLADIIAVYIGTNLLIFGDLPISQDSDPIQTAMALVIIVVALFAVLKLSPRWKKTPIKFALLLSLSSSVFILSKYVYLDWITIVGALVAVCILSLSVYSLYYLIIDTKSDRWLFILSLMASLPVPLLIADLINQGQSSTAPRYLIPLQLGILIAVSYTIGSKIASIKDRVWRWITLAFIALGIFSCVRNLNLSPFYQKGRNINNPAIAQIINNSNSALVTTEFSGAMDLASLAYSLSPTVKYQVISNEEKLEGHFDNFKDIYVLKPSSNLKKRLADNSQIGFQQVYKSHIFSADEFPLDLWQVNHIEANY